MRRVHCLAVPLILALSACASSYWDPTERVNSPVGHVGGAEAPPAGPGEAAAVALGEEEEAKGVEAPAQERYVGTGTFVKRVRTRAVPPRAGDITLNFDNTDLREVVKVILGDLLNVNYILDPAVQGSVTMQTGSPLSRDLLLPTLETLLRMNNAVLVDAGTMYRVLPVSRAVRGAGVPQLGQSRRPLPRGYSVRIVPLKYIGVAEMNKILEPLAPEGSIIRVDAVRNLLILAGTNPELESLLDTIEVFDVDWIKGLSVGFFRIEFAELSEIVEQLGTLFGGKEDSPLAGLFRIIPVESANSLLVITPQVRYLDEVGKWIRRLDRASEEGDGSERLYVYRVQHGDAENLADLLGSLFEESGTTTRAAARVAPGLRAAKVQSPGRSGSKEAGAETGDKSPARAATGGGAVVAVSSSSIALGDGVSIVADTVNNSLLIRATPAQYRKIQEALEQLDILPLQVLVEATIVEVTLTGELRYGLQWFFKTHHGSKTGNWVLDNSKDSGLAGLLPGFNWTLIDAADQIRAVLSAFAGDGLVNVLSSPSIMVLDNHTAKIQVGDSVPTLSSQSTSNIGGESPTVNSIEYRDTGVMLTVTPRVTPGGLVIMEVEQDVSDAVETATGVDGSPTIQTRNISSTVAVKDKQSVILGGLIRDKRENSDGGVPGLYKVPILGWAFGQTEKSAERNELVVVLTPRVITSATDIEEVTEDFRNKLRGLREKF